MLSLCALVLGLRPTIIATRIPIAAFVTPRNNTLRKKARTSARTILSKADWIGCELAAS